jgi:chorismate mutase
MSAEPTIDATLARLRGLLAVNDIAVLELINRRLELVDQIKRRKEQLGVAFVDPEREAWLLDHLRSANNGRLSDEGLRELLTTLLELTKRELSPG